MNENKRTIPFSKAGGSEKESTMSDNNTKVVTMEKCIVCGEETGYSFDTPVDLRRYYIEGAGQLCQKCYYDLYVKKNSEKKWGI